MFQSTHPRRVWQLNPLGMQYLWSFNPHTHEGCDVPHQLRRRPQHLVSIHTPTKGVTWIISIPLEKMLFQSTHPRRVWRRLRVFIQPYNVSIHTPTKGVTALHVLWSGSGQSFNPHTHEGCDLSTLFLSLSLLMFQSTHPRRVWRIAALRQATALQFQSTHPRRVWLISQLLMQSLILFQSTHPRRVWPSLFRTKTYIKCFNPHTHEGCDGAKTKATNASNVSIHTPTKGVT